MSYSFPALPAASSPVAGLAGVFPVRRIFCVGRNYAEHARKAGKDPDRDPPFFFSKPADTVVEDGKTVAYPPETQNFHCEAEPVVAIGKAGTDIPKDRARGRIFGYAIGNGLMRRDLQLEARAAGRPIWCRRGCAEKPVHPLGRNHL